MHRRLRHRPRSAARRRVGLEPDDGVERVVVPRP